MRIATWVAVLLCVALALCVAVAVTAAVLAYEAPDTDFRCRPGEVYTTKECP